MPHPSQSNYVGKKVIRLKAVDSTNAFASRLLRKEALPEGTAIRAGYQQAGKGQRGARWLSASGKNLLVSVVFYPSFLKPAHQFFLNQAVSLAVAGAIDVLAGDAIAHIKWPNDIIVGDKKVAGILIENVLQGNRMKHAVVGIGLNVNQKKFDKVLRHASSLAICCDRTFILKNVWHELFLQLEQSYELLKSGRMATLQQRYMSKLYRAGEESDYQAGGKRFRAEIAGLTAQGKLILAVAGRHEVYDLKEVEMVM